MVWRTRSFCAATSSVSAPSSPEPISGTVRGKEIYRLQITEGWGGGGVWICAIRRNKFLPTKNEKKRLLIAHNIYP